MNKNDDMPDIQAALAILKEGFIKKVPEKVEEIKQSWQLLKSSPNDNSIFHLLHRQAHSLSGTGATYGLEGVSDCAKQIELTLQSLPEQKDNCLPLAVIDELLNKLELAAELQATKKIAELSEYDSYSSTITLDKSKDNLIYLVDDDYTYCSNMKMQLEAFGYEVQVYSDLAGFDEAVARQEPSVVIMDVMFGSHSTEGIDHITKLNSQRNAPLRTIFITGTGDILTRLSAVRANGQAYFTKPVLVEDVVDTLDKVTSKTTEDPFNIVIVEDSKEQSQYIALCLQQVGMQTREVNGPLELLDVLAEQQADLILMDLYMPGCTGLELSQVVRQMDDYVSVPIVFLSAEQNLGKKLGAMSLGGDDFLTKPIEPWHLISAVTSRVLRGRTIRKLAQTDGLTSLLNHSASKERLEVELSNAKRRNTPLSLAMLDIDHFKRVNDTYGHPAGDRVLKSLATMFKQRLRRHDIIGRYGGEEFVVILPNTDAETAKRVIDTVRISFGELSHLGEDKEFHCHFSCGIASFPEIADADALSSEADKALYAAKSNGRNRVVCAASDTHLPSQQDEREGRLAS